MRQALMASHNDGARTTQVNAITVLKNNQNDVVLIKRKS